MGSNPTQFAFGLTNYLNRGQMTYLTNNGVSPFWTRVDKKETSGDFLATAVIYNNPQGWSSGLTQAQANATQAGGYGNVAGVKWLSGYGVMVGSLQIGDQVIKQSRDNFGAFMQNKKAEIDGFWKTFGKRGATYMLGNQGHTLTPSNFVFTTAAAGTCTCTDPNDSANIEVGQVLSISIGSGDVNTDILVAGQGDGFVVDVNRNTGVFHVSATSGGAPGTPTNWVNATTYFAFAKGEGGSSGFTGFTRVMVGFGAWIPSSDPSATGFETTINRTTDIVSLSGTRLSTLEQNGLNTEQRVARVVARMVGRNGADVPGDAYVHPEKFQDMIGTLENRGTRVLGAKIAGFNYQKIEMQTSEGAMNIWSEPRMPAGAVYVVNHDYILAGSLDGYPGKFNGDGFELVRMPTSMDYEMRGVCYPAFQVYGAGHQGRCTAA